MAEKILRNKSVLSAAGIITGIILMIWQRTALITLVRVTGYILIAAAIVYLVLYFSGKDKSEIQIGYAAVTGAGGLLMVLLSRTIVNIFPILMGVALIVSGIITLAQTFRNQDVPLYTKLLSAAAVIMGLLIVVRPTMITNAITFWIGAALTIGGISGLLSAKR